MTLNRNHLTKNKRYRILLEIVGKSKVPLTSTEIVHQTEGFGKYGYQMIEELCPIREKLDLRLFTWSEVHGTQETMEMSRHQKNDAVRIQDMVFRKLTSVYGVDWFDGDLEQSKYRSLKFERDDHKNVLRIYYDRHNQITIELDPMTDNAQLLIKLDGKEIASETLRAVKKKGEIGIYKPNYIFFGRYLTPALNKRSQELISKYKNYIPTGEESGDLDWFAMDRTKNNRRNWTYSLNIRGLMLYALSIYKEELKSSKKDKNSLLSTDKKRGRKKGERSYNIQFSKILENMTKNHLKEIPFLMFYHEFLDILPTNFSVNVIKELAYELQFQLDIVEIEDLRYYVAKRYYSKITNHIGLRERMSYLRDFNKKVIRKILEYRKQMLSYLIKNVKIEKDEYEKAYQRYVKDLDELGST